MANGQQPHYAQLHPAFQHHRYLLRRKFWTLVGAKVHVFDETETNLVMFCHMKGFKLKEDLRIYADETMTRQLLAIRARNILDISATYDIFDTTTGTEFHIGALRRKGLKSLLRDEWLILNSADQEIGAIQEESGALAILRRFIDLLSLFFPQQFNFTINMNPVGFTKQTFNPFIMKMHADFTQDPNGWLDRRIGAAAALLLVVIEGKQK